MKTRNVFLFGIASGFALVGLASYLLSSGKSKKASARMKKDGKRFLTDIEEVMQEARLKIEEMEERLQKQAAESEKSRRA